MNAAIAGHFGVPVIMVSGDDIAVAENQVIIGDIEGAVVKWASGFHSARTLTPEGRLRGHSNENEVSHRSHRRLRTLCA